MTQLREEATAGRGEEEFERVITPVGFGQTDLPFPLSPSYLCRPLGHVLPISSGVVYV